jgi:hypothetical protein
MKAAKRWGAALVLISAWMALASHLDAEKFEQPQADIASKNMEKHVVYSESK